MSGLKHNYSADTVPDKVLKFLEEKNLPFTASKMALMLDVAYSSVCYAILQLQESGHIEEAFSQREGTNPRAGPKKFYQITGRKPADVDFPRKINPKGYDNGYETQQVGEDGRGTGTEALAEVCESQA